MESGRVAVARSRWGGLPCLRCHFPTHSLAPGCCLRLQIPRGETVTSRCVSRAISPGRSSVSYGASLPLPPAPYPRCGIGSLAQLHRSHSACHVTHVDQGVHPLPHPHGRRHGHAHRSCGARVNDDPGSALATYPSIRISAIFGTHSRGGRSLGIR